MIYLSVSVCCFSKSIIHHQTYSYIHCIYTLMIHITCPRNSAHCDVICFSKRICASTVEACEWLFRHISSVCGTASSVRIEVFRTASSLCKDVNKVLRNMHVRPIKSMCQARVAHLLVHMQNCTAIEHQLIVWLCN